MVINPYQSTGMYVDIYMFFFAHGMKLDSHVSWDDQSETSRIPMGFPWKLPMKNPPFPGLPILMVTAMENAMEIAHWFDAFLKKW